MTRGGPRWKPKEIFPSAGRRKQEWKKMGNQVESNKNMRNSNELQETKKRKEMGNEN